MGYLPPYPAALGASVRESFPMRVGHLSRSFDAFVSLTHRPTTRIACHFPHGYTQHISRDDADELVDEGKANWRDKTSILLISNNPEPSTTGRRGSGKLACKVGAPLARAFYRDRNRSGWATAFVERVRELAHG